MYPMLHNNASGPEIGLPGRISAGANLIMSSPAGRQSAGRLTLRVSRLDSGRNPARKPDFGPEALLRNMKYIAV